MTHMEIIDRILGAMPYVGPPIATAFGYAVAFGYMDDPETVLSKPRA